MKYRSAPYPHSPPTRRFGIQNVHPTHHIAVKSASDTCGENKYIWKSMLGKYCACAPLLSTSYVRTYVGGYLCVRLCWCEMGVWGTCMSIIMTSLLGKVGVNCLFLSEVSTAGFVSCLMSGFGLWWSCVDRWWVFLGLSLTVYFGGLRSTRMIYVVFMLYSVQCMYMYGVLRTYLWIIGSEYADQRRYDICDADLIWSHTYSISVLVLK